ncbi:MAG: hypothetical protein RSF81_07820 [Oscillospiraceae bacterium]
MYNNCNNIFQSDIGAYFIKQKAVINGLVCVEIAIQSDTLPQIRQNLYDILKTAVLNANKGLIFDKLIQYMYYFLISSELLALLYNSLKINRII